MKGNKVKIMVLMANQQLEARDLEAKTGMPRSTLNKVLSGKTVKPVTIGKVANALGVDVREILEGAEV
ncbi:helix-turn-helix domain-containing protein [uncultured Enterococcus sp.]|uniref:helix-turn-helix domain-containing protein n=1 Tax=uncultured Enterococcus sp. TaxID=167972 RepID=UPI002596A0A7|nr:helix-turn-helix transcriptional regulator [uncultured Enterococcus sp.]